MNHPHRRCVIPQSLPGVRARVQHHLFGRAKRHHLPARIPAFRPQINQPVRGANHIQVVFNHHQRMAGVQQLAQGPHELGNVVKVQPGGRLVQHEQRALARQRLAARTRALGRIGQKSGQLEALRLPA